MDESSLAFAGKRYYIGAYGVEVWFTPREGYQNGLVKVGSHWQEAIRTAKGEVIRYSYRTERTLGTGNKVAATFVCTEVQGPFMQNGCFVSKRLP